MRGRRRDVKLPDMRWVYLGNLASLTRIEPIDVFPPNPKVWSSAVGMESLYRLEQTRAGVPSPTPHGRGYRRGCFRCPRITRTAHFGLKTLCGLTRKRFSRGKIRWIASLKFFRIRSHPPGSNWRPACRLRNRRLAIGICPWCSVLFVLEKSKCWRVRLNPPASTGLAVRCRLEAWAREPVAPKCRSATQEEVNRAKTDKLCV